MRSSLLRVYQEHLGDQIRVHAVGEIDLATAPLLDQALSEVAALPQVRSVVVNLTKVDFFSAAGLTVLLAAARRGADTGVPVRVVAHPRQLVHRAIIIAGLEGALALIDSLDRGRPQRANEPVEAAGDKVEAAGDKQLSRDRV